MRPDGGVECDGGGHVAPDGAHEFVLGFSGGVSLGQHHVEGVENGGFSGFVAAADDDNTGVWDVG